MKQIVILGLDYFGKSLLEELLEMNVEVLIIDKTGRSSTPTKIPPRPP